MLRFSAILLIMAAGSAWSAATYAAEAGAGKRATGAPATASSPKQDENGDSTKELTSRGLAGNFLAGQFARNTGDVDGAIYFLQKARKQDPENISVLAQLEGMFLLQGKIKEATDIAEDIHRYGGTDTDPVHNLLLVLRDLKQNKLQHAQDVMNEAFQNGSGQLWAPLISGWIDAAQKRLMKPLTIEELSANVGRTAPIVHYHLALINAFAGHKDAAAADFHDAVEDPKNPPTRVMAALMDFYERNGHPKSLTPVVDEYLRTHAPIDQAKADLVEDTPSIKQVNDGVAEVLYTMGSIVLSAGSTQDAVIYLQLALDIKPDLYAAALMLGNAYAELGQYSAANETYARIKDASAPQYTKAQLHIAINLNRIGEENQALALLDHVAAQLPRDTGALVAKGDLLRIHGKAKEAVDAYSQAIDRADTLTANDWPLLFARGACLERLGKWEEAEKDLRLALELKPDQPDVLNYLGYSWLSRGVHIAEARHYIEKALAARPNDAQIVDSMGWALYLAGEYEKASGYIEKAVQLIPSDPTVNDHLGDVYWRLGRKEEARYQWERALSFSPEKALEEEMHRKLREGLPPATSEQAEKPTPLAASEGSKDSISQ